MLSLAGDLLGRVLEVRVDNPGFPLSLAAAAREERRMRAEPRALSRPVVVVGGYRAWNFPARALADRLGAMTSRDRAGFASLAYPLSTDFSRIATNLCELVQARWPREGTGETVEVDVVGISMGGLVARAAAAGIGAAGRAREGRRLKIARLFTLGTPHRGARLADVACPDGAARDMRGGSAFLAALDAALPGTGYELVCYTRLRDSWVGATHTSPPGRGVHWVGGWRVLSHVCVSMDTRILVDIARRLRGEAPIARAVDDGANVPPPRD